MSFTEKLGNNQRNFAEEALLRTICEDPSQTIGEVWESLEADAEAEFMWDLFKKLSIGRLVTAAVDFAGNAQHSPEESPAAPAPAAPSKKRKAKPKKEEKQEEEDEFEEDDEFDEDEFDDDDDDDDKEEDAPKATRGSKKSSKGLSSKSKDKSKSSKTKTKGDGHLTGISDPDGKKKYQSSIIKFLKSKRARSDESGLRSTEIRDEVGGSPKQFRDNINELITANSVEFVGQARGMKYFLA